VVVVVVMAVVLLDPHAADHACCCGGHRSQVQAVRLSGAGTSTRVTLSIALAHPAIGAAGS
jgi:hypothetical protein